MHKAGLFLGLIGAFVPVIIAGIYYGGVNGAENGTVGQLVGGTTGWLLGAIGGGLFGAVLAVIPALACLGLVYIIIRFLPHIIFHCAILAIICGAIGLGVGGLGGMWIGMIVGTVLGCILIIVRLLF